MLAVISCTFQTRNASRNMAITNASDTDAIEDAPLSQVLDTQSETLDPLQRLENWLLSAIGIEFPGLPKSEHTLMATLMPYAPYLKCTALKDGFLEDKSACQDEMGNTAKPIRLCGTNRYWC